MDINSYKKFFGDQRVRFRILKALRVVPDSIMVRIQYLVKHRRWPDIRNPRRFSEWLQWYKVHSNNGLMVLCADKVGVRSFVESRGYGDSLTRLYQLAGDPAEIDFAALPNSFVVKANNGSGTNLFCKDKSTFDVQGAQVTMAEWLQRDNYMLGREWPYKHMVPLLLVEEMLHDDGNNFAGINDYKFMCFNGRASHVVLDVDRASAHKRNIYTRNWEDTGVTTDVPKIEVPVEEPKNLKEMIEMAEALSAGFPFVRVDLYSIGDQVKFGEMTFFPWTGYIGFEPDEFDFTLGSLWK